MSGQVMTVRKATGKDIETLAALAVQLWPGHETAALAEEFAGIVNSGDAACFLAWEDGRATGFAQCQLRHDYVEGTRTSPVGYLEGVFVEEAFRRRGCGRHFHLRVGFGEANRIICFRKDL